MEAMDGNAVIVFNGEIYNFQELRARLQALGHNFRTHGDTEVILARRRQWGGGLPVAAQWHVCLCAV